MFDLPLEERTAAKVLARGAELYGERPFVEFQGEVVSYRSANRRANRVANALAGLGVGKGTRVGILLSNRPEYLDLWFGLASIGAIQVPINTAYHAPQIRHVLSRGELPVIVVERALADELVSALADSGCRHLVILDGPPDAGASTAIPEHRYQDLLAAADDAAPPAVDVGGADISAIMNTSGTTGPSKGVLLPHGQQYWLARSMAMAMKLTGDDVFYNFFPMFHNTAQAMITLPVMLTGGRMLLRDRFSLSSFWNDIRTHGVTAFYFIGEILRLIVTGTSERDANGHRLRIGWGIGGAPRDYDEFEARFGVRLGTCYGSTEGNVPLFRALDARGASVGRPLPEFDVRIADAFDRLLPAGQIGEILVRSREPFTLMAGYDGNPVATTEVMRNQWFHSGDAGFTDAAGDFFFVGRIRDVIRVRGENVSALEVEEAVAAFPGVLEVAAIPVPAEIGGDDIKVAVVAADAAAFDCAELIQHCVRLLPKFSVPRYVELVAALPKTATNKVMKHVLRAAAVTPATWDRQSADADGTARKCV